MERKAIFSILLQQFLMFLFLISDINASSGSTTSSSGAIANISINTNSNTISNNAVIQTTNINSLSNTRQSLQASQHDTMINVTQAEASQTTVTQKQESKSEFIGGPPPGLPPLGPDSLVITNNNGKISFSFFFFLNGLLYFKIS